MEDTSISQIAIALGPYMVAILVPALTFLYQLLIDRRKRQQDWARFLAEKSLDACLTLLGDTKTLADEWASWRSSQQQKVPQGLIAASRVLKEHADYLRPLLPSGIREELHTAAYHIWGLCEMPQFSETDIDTFSRSIGRIQTSLVKLEKYLDGVNLLTNKVK